MWVKKALVVWLPSQVLAHYTRTFVLFQAEEKALVLRAAQRLRCPQKDHRANRGAKDRGNRAEAADQEE